MTALDNKAIEKRNNKGYHRQPQEIAAMFAKANESALLWERATGRYWHHDAKARIWRLLDADDLFDDVSAFIELHGSVDLVPQVTKSRVDNAISQLRRHVRKVDDIGDETHLTFSDCQLDFVTLLPVPYNPVNFSMQAYDFPFSDVASAKGELLDKYISDTCLDENGITKPEMRGQMAEILAFALIPDPMEYAVYLTGETENGKSPLIAIARGLVGRHRTSSFTIEAISTKPFVLAATAGKKANLLDDEESDKSRLDIVKRIISCQPFTDRPMYGKDREFLPKFRLIFSANKPPNLAGFDSAMRRRFFVLPFDHKVDKKKMIPRIGEKIVSEELPAVVKFALEGVKSLRENTHRFTVSARSEEALDQFERENNSAMDYLSENWRKDEDGRVPNYVLYKLYREWCESSGRKYFAEIGFGRVASRMFGRSVVIREKGKLVRNYRCTNAEITQSETDAPPVAAQFEGRVVE